MPRCDQRHGLDVYHALRKDGCQDEALLVAALLHDVGKAAARLTIAHRVTVVLIERAFPGWLARWAGAKEGWRAPFAAHVQHAHVGAAWAQAAGSSTDTVTLIREHHVDAPQDKRLVALQEADKSH
jgi:putative nucleotidyltransferase with HDIG domain